MPALTFRHSTPHSSQNCRVFHATATGTEPASAATLTSCRRSSTRRASSRAPAADSRTRRPSWRRSRWRRDDKRLPRRRPTPASRNASSARRRAAMPIIAPPPNPMIARPGRHAAPIRKPFDQRRDRRDVAEAEAASADDAGADPEQPDLMQMDAERGDEEPAAQQHAATKPALRGPSRSTHAPNSAADDPSITKNSVYI